MCAVLNGLIWRKYVGLRYKIVRFWTTPADFICLVTKLLMEFRSTTGTKIRSIIALFNDQKMLIVKKKSI
jgi:hypothetical protein